MVVASLGSLSASALESYFDRDLKELAIGEGQFQYYGAELGAGKAQGKGAAALGLDEVDQSVFSGLGIGFGPAGQALRQNAGIGDDAAWDLTLSWDKTSSLAFVLGDDETRARIAENAQATVKKSIELVESLAITRRGKGGHTHEPVEGIVAVPFWHFTSRYGPDPQLHCHIVIFNVCLRQDGTWGALHSHALYMAKKTIGRLATAEDAANWIAEGVRLQETEHGSRIAAMPQGLCDETSTGRKAILATANQTGVSSPKDLELINLDLRPPKTAFNMERLLRRWKRQGRAYGVTEQSIQAMYGEVQVVSLDQRRSSARRAVREALSETEIVSSTFSAIEISSLAAHKCRDGRAGMEDILRAVKHVLRTDARVTRVELERGQQIYSTKRNEELERRALEAARHSRNNRTHMVSGRYQRASIRDLALDVEQARAVRKTAGTKGSIKLITGNAGTGKTRTLAGIRQAEEASGRRVTGAAPTGVARQELESGAQIKDCYTVTKLLALIEPPLSERLGHQAWMIGRAALKLPTYKRARIRLGKKDTVIVDEAAMVGFHDMARLILACKRSGAKLVLCGDDRQLGPVLAGASMFTELRRLLGAAVLARNWRQRQHPWMQDLNRHLVDGESHEALRLLIDKNRLRVSKGLNSPLTACADYYIANRTEDHRETLVIASTRAQVSELNTLIQQARFVAGELGRSTKVTTTLPEPLAHPIYVGDRVVLRRNSLGVPVSLGFKAFRGVTQVAGGVVNGDFGVVVATHGKKVRVLLDRTNSQGDRLYATIDTNRYSDLELGYAVTAVRSQGKTVDQALLVADSAYLDAEQGYVAMTRQARELQVFAHEATLGEELRDLSRALVRSRRQELAAEIRLRLQESERITQAESPRIGLGQEYGR